MHRIRNPYIAFVVLYAAFEYVLIYAVPKRIDIVLAAETVPPLVSCAVLYAVSRRHDGSERLFWRMLSVSNFMYALAQMIWNGYEWFLDKPAPVPSIADLLWNVQSGVVVLALGYKLFKEKSVFQGIRFAFDAAILLLSAGTLSWEYLIKPNVSTMLETNSYAMTATVVGYPVADLGIVGCLFLAHFAYGNIFHPYVMRALTIGMMMTVTADTGYLAMLATNRFEIGSWVDPLWSLGMFTVGLAGILSVKHRAKAEGDSGGRGTAAEWMRVFVPYAVLFVLLLLLVIRIGSWDLLFLGCVATIVCIVVRQVVVLIENDVLFRKLESSLERTRFLAHHDTLSNLPNRRCFELSLSEAIAQAGNDRSEMAVMFIDMDRFKYVNDTLGHLTGDRLIRMVSDRFRAIVVEPHLIARQGGDEFTVLLRQAGDPERVCRMARLLAEAAAEPIRIGEHEVRMTASIGIAVYPRDGTDTFTLMKNADAAMYRAKELGGNRYEAYTERLNGDMYRRWTLEYELRRALERDELVLYYQPQVEAKGQAIVGVEALIRWHAKDGRIVSPAEFIPIAEETGLIVPIGEWVLRTACRQAVTWKKRGKPGVEMAVNVSPRQIRQDDFVERVKAILDETGMDPHDLQLEITESVAIEETNDAERKLAELKRLGIRLAMDDFGTGYSSLGYLQSFGVDTLKISQMFIRDVSGNESLAGIVRAIVAMATSLRLTIVAEGVEDQAQYEFLKSLGCDRIQGYYFHKPMPQQEIGKLFLESVS
ncbi:putative bifunctional diguanylate cyclase/phosphodiesterase [Paenibacillus flagellatus]|nr:EAL domain-containing protein [Paenibacillus flagellatus]